MGEKDAVTCQCGQGHFHTEWVGGWRVMQAVWGCGNPENMLLSTNPQHMYTGMLGTIDEEIA